MTTKTTENERLDVAPETGEDTRSRAERTVGVSRLLRRETALIFGGAAIVILLWGGFSGWGTPEQTATPDVEEASPPSEASVQPSLSGQEYLDLGRAALGATRIADAERLISAGLVVAESGQGRLRAELCRAMADVCNHRGETEVAAVYRNQAAELVSGLDATVLAVFSSVDDDVRAGRTRNARERLHQIALGGGPGEPGNPALVRECQRRLALTYEQEYLSGRVGRPLDRLPDPVLFEKVGSR